MAESIDVDDKCVQDAIEWVFRRHSVKITIWHSLRSSVRANLKRGARTDLTDEVRALLKEE